MLTGTYSGGSITLPMNNLSVATPIGVVAPAPTGPGVQRLRPAPGLPGRRADPDAHGGGADGDPDADAHADAHRDPDAHEDPDGTGPYGDPHTDPDPHADAHAPRTPSRTPTRTPSRTATRTPTRTRTPTPGGSQVLLRIEAEAPVLTSPMASANDSGAFGGKLARTMVADAGTGDWTFSVPSPGTYVVWCRVKSAQLVRRLVLREDGLGDRGRLRHGGRHVVAELAVDAAERTGRHGRAPDAESAGRSRSPRDRIRSSSAAAKRTRESTASS